LRKNFTTSARLGRLFQSSLLCGRTRLLDSPPHLYYNPTTYKGFPDQLVSWIVAIPLDEEEWLHEEPTRAPGSL